MTQRQYIISRQHFYDIKDAIAEEGLEGLIEKTRSMPRIGNRVAPEIEERVLAYSLDRPTHGQVRVANELAKQGIAISAGGVRGVWLRHGLETKGLRLKRLEFGLLTESQVQALEDAKQEREAYGEVESPHPAFLVAQDTCYVGYIKGVGKLYHQAAIDTHSNVGFVKLYPEKTSLTACDLLNDRVLPFFDEQMMRLLRVLTDNGREYCGTKENHAYQLFLHLNEIEHTKTRVRRPQTNGAVERLNQTVQEEFYKVAFRKKLYGSIEEIQADLDEFMAWYNTERTNQGRYCQGRTPMETFLADVDLYQRFVYDNEEVMEEAA